MLQLHQIHKTYRQKTVCHDINLTVSRGELVAILGKSGSGKSTLLNIIAGLTAADGGSVWIDGINHTHSQPEQRQMAMMFQDFALLPHLNVWQNVAFGLRMRGVNAQQSRQHAEQMLHEVGLHDMATQSVQQLSGGEQQRVALARALVVQPKVLLLDEPFSSLDTHLRQQLQQQVCDLVKRHGIAAILVSHDPAEACLMADTLVLLDSGCVIQQGTPAQLCARPVNVVAARLLGCLNVNEWWYIPPSALVLGRGEPCDLREVSRQPNGWRVALTHEKWGDLVVHSAVQPENALVWVDETQIVEFE